MTVRDLVGKSFLITGANTGIGRSTAEEIAARGGKVFLACRNQQQADEVISGIRRRGGDAEYLACDLGDLESVRRCAETFLARKIPLDVLINNAGVGGQRGATKQGFEVHFGVNHLGHFLLTKLLLEGAERPPRRVVNVASKLHFDAKGIDFAAVERGKGSLTGIREYAESKLCNVLFTQELARRYEGQGVEVFAVHPGAVASDIWRRVPSPLRELMTKDMAKPTEGARASVDVATATRVEGENGAYFEGPTKVAPSLKARDLQLARQLWDKSEEYVRGQRRR